MAQELIGEQLLDRFGNPVPTATWELYDAATNRLLRTGQLSAIGTVSIDETDVADAYKGKPLNVKISSTGFVWWVRGVRSAMLKDLAVTGLMRAPRYTTTQRDRLVLDTNDKGVVIYNTTTEELETWTGAAWTQGGGTPGSHRDDVARAGVTRLQGELDAHEAAQHNQDLQVRGQLNTERTERISGDNALSARLGALALTAGGIAVNPSAIAAYTDLDGDYTLAAEDLDVTALNAAGVDQYEIWFKSESVHTANWSPVADFVAAFNVSTSEETQIGLDANDKLIPVRLVFRHGGNFVALINTWIEIGDLASGKQDTLPTLGAGQVWAGPSATPTDLPTGGGGGGQAGSISLTPSVIPNAAGIVRDFKFAWEDLDVAALNAGGVNEFELWIKDTAFHAVDPWTPTADGVIDVNVNATEALAIALGSAEIVPVRMVFRNSGTFVSLINSWLEVGGPTHDSLVAEIQHRIGGDLIHFEEVADGAAFQTAVQAHTSSRADNPLLILVQAAIDVTFDALRYQYPARQLIYFVPSSSIPNPWFVLPEGVSILDGSITTAKLADRAVTGAKVALGTIESANLSIREQIQLLNPWTDPVRGELGGTYNIQLPGAGGVRTGNFVQVELNGRRVGGRVAWTQQGSFDVTPNAGDLAAMRLVSSSRVIVSIAFYNAANAGNELGTAVTVTSVVASTDSDLPDAPANVATQKDYALRVPATSGDPTWAEVTGGGSEGPAGVNGSYERTIFQAASSRPAAPTSPNSVTAGGNPALPSGWAAGPPGGTTPIWASVQRVARGATAVTYTTPVRWDGEDGTDGTNGRDGTNGQDGADGAKGANGTSITLTRYANAAAAPATVPANTIAFWPRPSS